MLHSWFGSLAIQPCLQSGIIREACTNLGLNWASVRLADVTLWLIFVHNEPVGQTFEFCSWFSWLRLQFNADKGRNSMATESNSFPVPPAPQHCLCSAVISHTPRLLRGGNWELLLIPYIFNYGFAHPSFLFTCPPEPTFPLADEYNLLSMSVWLIHLRKKNEMKQKIIFHSYSHL